MSHLTVKALGRPKKASTQKANGVTTPVSTCNSSLPDLLRKKRPEDKPLAYRLCLFSCFIVPSDPPSPKGVKRTQRPVKLYSVYCYNPKASLSFIIKFLGFLLPVYPYLNTPVAISITNCSHFGLLLNRILGDKMIQQIKK